MTTLLQLFRTTSHTTRIQVDPTTARTEAVVHLVSIYRVFQTLGFFGVWML